MVWFSAHGGRQPLGFSHAVILSEFRHRSEEEFPQSFKVQSPECVQTAQRKIGQSFVLLDYEIGTQAEKKFSTGRGSP